MVERARAMASLTETLTLALPAELAGALIAANVRENEELVVIAASPAWAARLRFESDSLITAANKAGEQVKTCTVKVTHDAGT
ncbi:MAG: DUF721 domain-containing protein [Gammaproteobacteria bacterium]|nr:DUF721 domain-containing protein [Gammaproteobacteria bacterium]NNC76469.1 DUF721 domain-containing protein [Woeseiaceae bacterium]